MISQVVSTVVSSSGPFTLGFLQKLEQRWRWVTEPTNCPHPNSVHFCKDDLSDSVLYCTILCCFQIRFVYDFVNWRPFVPFHALLPEANEVSVPPLCGEGPVVPAHHRDIAVIWYHILIFQHHASKEQFCVIQYSWVGNCGNKTFLVKIA